MSINVQHAANPSVVLGASFGAGQAEARRRAQLEAAQALERQGTREDQQAFQREMTGGDQAFQRERIAAGQDFQREMTAGGQDFQRVMQGARLTADAEKEFEGLLTSSETAASQPNFTSDQLAEIEKLRNGYAEVQTADDKTPEEKMQMGRRILARISGMRPPPAPKDWQKGKSPAEVFAGTTFTDPKTGAIFPIENGVPGRPIYEPPAKETSWQDKIKVQDLKLKRMELGFKMYADQKKIQEDRDYEAKKAAKAAGEPEPPSSTPVTLEEVMKQLPPMDDLDAQLQAAEASREDARVQRTQLPPGVGRDVHVGWVPVNYNGKVVYVPPDHPLAKTAPTGGPPVGAMDNNLRDSAAPVRPAGASKAVQAANLPAQPTVGSRPRAPRPGVKIDIETARMYARMFPGDQRKIEEAMKADGWGY